jgi:acetyl-CoA carboxylase biotin carboxyl carrier protein
MTEEPKEGTDDLRTLWGDAAELVRSQPGRLRRIAIRVVDRAVEIEWPEEGGARSSPIVESVAEEVLTAPAAALGHVVTAPLVGTFYRASQPGADPFVSVGDLVSVGDTLAIVEAMKLMNRIDADTAGRIVEIYPSDGEPIQYDQPLVCIAPADDVN